MWELKRSMSQVIWLDSRTIWPTSAFNSINVLRNSRRAA